MMQNSHDHYEVGTPATKRVRYFSESQSTALCSTWGSNANLSYYTGSSWLDCDVWFSKTPGTDATMGGRKLQNCDLVHPPVSEQITSLQRQLRQIKRRLGPAAQKSACRSRNRSSLPIGDNGDDEDVNMSCSRTTPHEEFEQARRTCNPYEVLGEGRHDGLNSLFMNRSAVKLANIDALIGLSLTQFHGHDGPFRFVDLCGAPGGFSEYIMYRCQQQGIKSYRGYGMSLAGTNEHGRGVAWKLDHMASLLGGSLAHYRVCNGVDGTADIYNWDNVVQLRHIIAADLAQAGTPDRPVNECGKAHLVLADGGCDAQRDHECQEEVAQKLVICQAAGAMALLQRGGTFVLKMFGFQTPPIRSLMAKLFRLFSSLIVLKPISSRPASAERYVIFAGFEGRSDAFDGLKWRNQVFLGEENDGTDTEFPASNDVRLRNYLDCLDREILELNVKSCFDILSYLEQQSVDGVGVVRRVNIDSNRDSSHVDVEAYRRVWSLE